MAQLERSKVNEIVENIKDFDLVHEFRLCSGNCGIFAIALRKLLEEGELWHFGICAHIVLKVDEKFVDGNGIQSFDKLKEEWNYHSGDKGWRKDDMGEDYIIRETSKTLEVQEMTNILLMLADSQVEKAQDYYHKIVHRY